MVYYVYIYLLYSLVKKVHGLPQWGGGGTSKRRRSTLQNTKTFSFAIWGGGGHFVTLVSVGRGGGVIK